MNNEMKLVLIHSGEDEEGLQPALVKWVADVLAQRAEFEPWWVEPAHLMARSDNAVVQESLRHLADADAFLIITSEHRNVHHCELKAFIDRVSDRWHARPVAFIGYGAASGGLGAIEQLRQELAGGAADVIHDTVLECAIRPTKRHRDAERRTRAWRQSQVKGRVRPDPALDHIRNGARAVAEGGDHTYPINRGLAGVDHATQQRRVAALVQVDGVGQCR